MAAEQTYAQVINRVVKLGIAPEDIIGNETAASG